MRMRKIGKGWIPPAFIKLIHTISHHIFPSSRFGLSGNYATWNDALKASTGYDSDHILEKTKQALLKVKNGEAVYERDSVLFDDIQYSWPLLAGLMWVAAQSGGRLNVLDFGGSLGSTYFQNREFLNALPEVRWNIIEQPDHVRVGKEFFEDEILRFYPNIKEYSKENSPDVILLSSVMQYLENPYETLESIFKLTSSNIILDKTPFWNGEVDRLCVQHVPPSIYEARYPSWIFSRSKILKLVETEGWTVIAHFENDDYLPGPVEFSYEGMIISRNL